MFGWTYTDGQGNELGRSPHFGDREDAESWLGQTWQGLLDLGIEEVSLFDHRKGERLYRMGLQPE